MKQITTLLIGSIIIASCSNDTYTINGIVPDDANGKIAYIKDYNTSKVVDSVMVVDGKFSFSGSSEIPTIFGINIKDTYYWGEVLSENREITMNFIPEQEWATVSSGGLNDGLEKMNQNNHAISMEFESLSNKYAGQEEFIDIYREKTFEVISSAIASVKETISLNKDNILGVYCIDIILDDMSLMQADSLLNEVPLARDYAPIMSSYNKTRARELTKIGAKFMDFSGENIDGTPAKLSDYVGKGKYVLVDFWASWCGPCIAEMPNLMYVYENFPELIVLGVNVWDSKDAFHKYIKDKKNPWAMMYASDDKTATEIYGISSIPEIILFDPQGVIVDRGDSLRGGNMKNIITEIYNK